MRTPTRGAGQQSPGRIIDGRVGSFTVVMTAMRSVANNAGIDGTRGED